MFQRVKGRLGRLLSSSTSAWVAVPVGFSLAGLATAPFGGDRKLVPFAVYVAVVVVSGVVTTRTVLAANLGLAVGAFVFGAAALTAVTAAVDELRHHGRSGIGLFVVLLAVATPTAVVCGVFVRAIVTLHRAMRARPSTSNEATSGHH